MENHTGPKLSIDRETSRIKTLIKDKCRGGHLSRGNKSPWVKNHQKLMSWTKKTIPLHRKSKLPDISGKRTRREEF